MRLKKIGFRIPSPSFGVGLTFLAMTQLPLAINQALNLACVATTWADYAVFWQWEDIPLDARVRYCNGGSNPPILSKERLSPRN